jgi:hypothetical protein
VGSLRNWALVVGVALVVVWIWDGEMPAWGSVVVVVVVDVDVVVVEVVSGLKFIAVMLLWWRFRWGDTVWF